MSSTLPIELVREIISHVLLLAPAEDSTGITSKPSWESISSLVTASKMFRILTLEFWFWRLFITNPHELLEGTLLFKEIQSSWTREIHCTQTLPSQPRSMPIWTIRGFKKLKRLRFDWVMPIPGDQSFRLSHYDIQPTITELDLRGMEWPSPNVLQSFSSLFPALEVLRLEQDSVWCGLCHLCCTPSFQEPCPTSITYRGGTGLPVHYLHALATLMHLKEVYISVGCDNSGSTRLASSSQRNENLWSGECDECMVNLYSDEEFRGAWVAKKTAYPARPPRLDRVDWNFYTTLQAPPYLFGYEESDSTSEV
ncbi:hypothetical protein PM082_008462 [Marasmius tenuissimus]|nr:hypothetical protein PM082_008462 [Marasmius tenuissimus]